ncbi:hypothetical protein [Chitinophaga sp. YIM B06452]|uniref:hypothetical protein n=1 Tax=Chitinophaga sp. YIM B06452 TaxID=3082158 RepID=UPI0031FE4667
MKRIVLLPLFILVVTCTIFSCSQEGELSEEDARTGDLRDSTDYIDTDTIPYTDPAYRPLEGLNITPRSSGRGILLSIETKNYYPHKYVTLMLSNYNLSFWEITVHNAYPVKPYDLVPSRARYTVHNFYVRGETSFTIKLRDVKYSGTLTELNNIYTFNWTHDSVITISPKSFSR